MEARLLTIQSLIIDDNDLDFGELKKLNHIMICFGYNNTKILDFSKISDIFQYIKDAYTKTSLFD